MEADKFLEEQDIFDTVPEGPAKFESAEHEALGAACTLRWPDGVTSTGGDPNFPLVSVPLTGRSYKGTNYELTFNKVVPIAGDFFTTFDYLPISYGTPRTFRKEEEKDATLKGPKTTMKGRFQQALDMLAQDAVGTVGPVLDKLDADIHLADEIHDHGHQHASQVYGGTDTTGGGFTGNMGWGTAMLGGGLTHYLTSLAMNVDHFGVWAQDVYTIGHSIALDLAEKGCEKGPDGKVRSSCERLTALQEAYFAESFAAHYMTDLFSAGHLRANRREFHKAPSLKTAVGGIISGIGAVVDIPVIDDVAYDLIGGQTKDTWDMQVNKFHENDGTAGLLVRNAKRERWIAYGDKQFFSPANRASRLRSVAACQAGIDEVFDVWSGKKSKPIIVFARENDPDHMYEALKQAPLPSEYLASEDGPWNGTMARLWQVAEASQTKPWDDAKGDAAVTEGKYSRRVDVNDMDNFDMKPKANPGWKYAGSSIGSEDVLEVVDKSFIGKKEAFPPVPMAEMLSGGFLQIQEYKDRNYPNSKLDHALNFWGPAKFAITGEPQDKPQPSFMLRRRWDSITYPTDIGRIQGDQTTLHWVAHTRSGIYTDVIRVFHRESNKSINVNMYTFTSAKDQNDPAGLSEVKPGGLPLFPEAELKIEYDCWIWNQNKLQLSLRDCSSMRFLNFYKSAPGDNPRNLPRKHNQIVGFRTFTREVTDAKGAKSDRMEYEPVFLLNRIINEWPSKTGFACVTIPIIAWDDSDGLTTPDFLKTYQNVDGQDQALLVIRRLGTLGTGTNDKEMDVEIRCYRWANIIKQMAETGFELPKVAGKAHPCCSIYKVKIKAPVNFTGPLSDPGAWQVLVDDFRNCGRPELVFIVGKEIGEYRIQVFGFDGESLVERNIGAVPPLPAELPASSWWVSNVGRHHFTAFCPSETIPWTHDIVQASDYLWYGKSDPLRLKTPTRYLYFRTWIKGSQTPPTTGIPPEWQDRPSRVEYHWQSQNLDCQPCATAQKIPQKDPIPSGAPAVGWSKVVDGLVYDSAGNLVIDEFSMNKYFFSIKWTRCAVKIPVNPKARGADDAKVTTTRGLQEIFSYYGVLGMRVFAPMTKGDYSRWQLVVQVPFLGQTSRGTGKTAGGSWNSASILPWGTANEFGDVNEWNRSEKSWKHFNKGDSWDKLEHGYGTEGKPYQFGK